MIPWRGKFSFLIRAKKRSQRIFDEPCYSSTATSVNVEKNEPKLENIITFLLIHSHAACLWDEAKKFDSHRDVKLSRIVAAADFSCSECSELFLMKCGSQREEKVEWDQSEKHIFHFSLLAAFRSLNCFKFSLAQHNVMTKEKASSRLLSSCTQFETQKRSPGDISKFLSDS